MRHTNAPRKRLAVNQVQADSAPKVWADLSLTARMRKSERVSLVRLNEEFARLYGHVGGLQSQVMKAARANRDAKVSVLTNLITRSQERLDEISREAYRLIYLARRRDAKRLAPAQAKQAATLKALRK